MAEPLQKQMPDVASNPMTEKMRELLNYDELSNCMRCGFCLPACPTFRETGKEASSPRGRIALMKAVVDGHMEAGQQVEDQLNQCLGCRACEPACPAGVQYGELLEQARDAIEDHAKHPWWVRVARKLAFTHLFPQQNRMRWLGRAISFYQKSGLQWLTRKLNILSLFPEQMKQMEAIMPQTKGSGVAKEMGTYLPAKGEKIGTVAMFSGCIMDIMFLKTNKNTVQLLTEAGFDVRIPEGQNCCGALHAHSGERETARELARKNIKAFKETQVDYIVSNAGGCGALLKEYHHLLADDVETKQDALWFASRVKDISELIMDHSPLRNLGTLEQRVTYQGSCHLQNGMKVRQQPRQMIQQIAGVEYIELHESERCCGSAGIYNLVQPEMADRILTEKMEHVKETKADILVTSNPGCLLQMKAGIHKSGLAEKMRAVHLVDLVVEAKREQR